MTKHKAILLLVFCVNYLIMSCSGQGDCTNITEGDYHSYSSRRIGNGFTFVNRKTKYNTEIERLFEGLGMPGVDMKVQQVQEYGAFAMITKSCRNRYILYSQSFFDRVLDEASMNAVRSIGLHEIGHHIYYHPLDNSRRPRAQEKMADFYTGFQVSRLNIDTTEAISALEMFANLSQTDTHPSKKVRLEEFRKGYLEGQKPFLSKEIALAMDKKMYAQEGRKSLEQIMNSEESGIQSLDKMLVFDFGEALSLIAEEGITVYSLLGDLVFRNADDQLRYADEGENKGRIIRPFEESSYSIFQLESANYILEENQIYANNPDGTRMRVGFKLN